MGGFLSAYSGTRKVDLGDGYWVEIKECLSVVEKQRAEKALSSGPVFDQNGRGTAQMDMPAFHTEMVVASVVAWNLDEEDGSIWALSPEPVKRKNIARLPAPVFDQVFQAVNELNGPQSAKERAQFPEPGVGGDPDGNRGAAEPGDVLDGAATVAAPGAASSGPGEPSVA
jgi:hypothetical protein